MKQSVLEKRIEIQNKTNEILSDIPSKLNLQKNQFYTLKEIKDKLTQVYEDTGINKKAKATDIDSLYNLHKTVKNADSGYLIISKK